MHSRMKERIQSTPRPVILSEDCSLRGERNEQPQSKDPCPTQRSEDFDPSSSAIYGQNEGR